VRTRWHGAIVFSGAGLRTERAIPTASCACSIADAAPARLEGDLLHASAESLDDYIAKQNRYTSLQAAALHAQGGHASALRLALSPLARFIRFYVLKLGFLDGAAGFAHIAIGAFASFLKYAKLRALAEDARGGR